MRLTRFTDYALRTLIYLGLHEPRQSSIAEIARAYDISKTSRRWFISSGVWVWSAQREGAVAGSGSAGRRGDRGRRGGAPDGGRPRAGGVLLERRLRHHRALPAQARIRRGAGGLPGSSRSLHAGGSTGGWIGPGDRAAPGYFFTNTDSVEPLDLRPQDVTLRYSAPVSLLTGSRQSTRGRSSARPRPALVAPRCVLSTTVAQSLN